MGQYWIVVNLDKREFINPHKLGVGLKLGEQIGSGHGTPDALFILTTAMRERRGGGDFDLDYHGEDRVKNYSEVARRTIGRWAGDRVAVVGDYAEDSDLPNSPVPCGKIYGLCNDVAGSGWKDVSEDVAQVIEHEVGGKFSGDGWRAFAKGFGCEHGDRQTSAAQFVDLVPSRGGIKNGIRLIPYTWRSKKYKTVTGLSRAVYGAYPGCRIGFNEDTMRLRWNDGRELLFDVVRNHPKANEVARDPI